METTPKRIRRKWFDVGPGSRSPLKRQTATSPLQPAASWPVPPSADQRSNQPAVRQHNGRHSATGFVSNVRGAVCVGKQQQLLPQQQSDGKTPQGSAASRCDTYPHRPVGELRPQPPAVARSLLSSKSRPKTKDAAVRADAIESQEGPVLESRYKTMPADAEPKAPATEPAAASTLQAFPVQTAASRPRAPSGCRPLGSRAERLVHEGGSSVGRVSRTLRATNTAAPSHQGHPVTPGRQATPASTALKGSTSMKPSMPYRSASRSVSRHAGSPVVFGSSGSSQRQQLIAALRLLRQKQQDSPFANGGQTCPGAEPVCNSTVEHLRMARDNSAAAAAAALEEVLLLDRALDLAQDFKQLQLEAARVEPAAAEQVVHVDMFTALSSNLQQLLLKQQKQQQAKQQQSQDRAQQPLEVGAQAVKSAEHLHHKTPLNRLAATPGHTPGSKWQQQGSCSSNIATLATASASAATQSSTDPFAWCSVANDNPLFISTPASNAGTPPWTSPSKRHCGSSNAVRSDTTSHADSYWGDMQPAQTSLHAVGTSEQQLQQKACQQVQQEGCAGSSMLQDLRQQAHQWFVSYVSEKLCQEAKPVANRAECLDLLKALTRAQQWVQELMQAESAGDKLHRLSCCALDGSVCSGAVTAGAEVSHVVLPKTPGSQLQHLQVAMRKQLCRYGYLRHQLPA